MLSDGDTVGTIAVIQLDGIPKEVHHLITQYADIFQTPTSLPHPRAFDHHIQLVPGATPVNI